MVKRSRHILKTVTWRLIASTDTLLIGWLLTGQLTIGFGIAGLEVITKTILYYAHERVWYKFSKFGVE